MVRPFLKRCCRALAALVLTGVTCAQPPETPARPQQQQPINRPFAARRIVFQFDFEPDPREVFEIPRYWDLANDGAAICGPRPGFPAWNTATFDPALAYSGTRSVRVSTKGGSASLRLEPGVIPVFPGTEYLVSARVQTRGLTHSRAAVTARYLDKANKPIPGAESRSELIATAPGEWRLATAPLADHFPAAAYVQIDLEILQPQQYDHSEPDPHRVWLQDFAGDAWFDLVAVVQLPRAAISTQSPVNILRAPQKPRVSISIRDLTGERITGEITLQDASGRTVDTQTRPLNGDQWDWDPRITAFGWYRATLELRSNQRRIGATHSDFVWLPPQSPETRALADSPDAALFSIILPSLPDDQARFLPDILLGAGGGAVTLPVWSNDLKAADVATRCQDLVPVVEKLRGARQQVTFSLPSVPEALSVQARVETTDPLSLFAGDEKLWSPYLIPLLDRFGQGVQRWQIGTSAGPRTRTPDVSRLYKLMAGLVPGPVIELPWPGEQAPPKFAAGQVEFLATLPQGAAGPGLEDLVTAWRAATPAPAKGAAPLNFLIETLDQPANSRLDSCIDLVMKAVELWAASAGSEPIKAHPPSLAIVQPWDWSSPTHLAPAPHAELAAFGNLADRLRDRRYAGRLRPSPGIVCIILEPAPSASPSRTGALVVWRESPGVQSDTLDLYLGQNAVEVVDLFGNREPLHPVSPGAKEPAGAPASPVVHRIPVREAPVFVENVDVGLALFAASLKLEPAFLPANSTEHDVSVLLSNPWKSRIEGRLTVLEPGGLSSDPLHRDRSWRIAPRTSTFSIGPGDTGRIPMSVAFSAVEEAGLKDFLVQIELAGAGNYAPIRIHTSLEVGVEAFQLEAGYRIPPGTQDVSVEAIVTNRSTAVATYELSAVGIGFPRAKAFITDLPPGGTATRRFSFPGGATRLRGQRIVIGVQNPETQERITRSVAVE